MDYKDKYIKYKLKYIQLTNLKGGNKKLKKQSKKLSNKNKLSKMESNNTKPYYIENVSEPKANSSRYNISRDNKLSPFELEIQKQKIDYIENVSEPWFTLISLGLKTVEGRKNKGRFKEMKVGNIVQWTNNDFGTRTVLTEITGKSEYPTFQEYLETEGLGKCLPGIKDIETGLNVYFKYFTKQDEKEFGVVAIKLKLI